MALFPAASAPMPNTETAFPAVVEPQPAARVVNSVAYRDGKRLADLSIEDISEAIREPDTFVWLGLHEAGPETLAQIQEEFSLHELAIEDARNAHQRPKLEVYGESLFIVIKTA